MKKQIFSLNIDASIMKEVDRMATAGSLNRSEMVESIISLYIKEKPRIDFLLTKIQSELRLFQDQVKNIENQIAMNKPPSAKS